MTDHKIFPETHTVYLVFQVSGYPQVPRLDLIEKVAGEVEAIELIKQLTQLSIDAVGNCAYFKYIKAEVVK